MRTQRAALSCPFSRNRLVVHQTAAGTRMCAETRTSRWVTKGFISWIPGWVRPHSVEARSPAEAANMPTPNVRKSAPSSESTTGADSPDCAEDSSASDGAPRPKSRRKVSAAVVFIMLSSAPGAGLSDTPRWLHTRELDDVRGFLARGGPTPTVKGKGKGTRLYLRGIFL